MKTPGMNFGENAEGALKSLFGAAKDAVKGAGSLVDKAIDNAMPKESAEKKPHLQLLDTVHSATPVDDSEVVSTGWFNAS